MLRLLARRLLPSMMFCAAYVGINLLADIFAIMANPRRWHPR